MAIKADPLLVKSGQSIYEAVRVIDANQCECNGGEMSHFFCKRILVNFDDRDRAISF